MKGVKLSRKRPSWFYRSQWITKAMLVTRHSGMVRGKPGPGPVFGSLVSWGRPSSQTGLAIVELAAVGFVLALVFAGVTTYGVRFYQKNTLTKAIQDASRYYAMHCATDGHGSSTTGAYGGALAILTANIAGLKVMQGGNPTTPDINYVAANTTVSGFTGDLSTSCGTLADSCEPSCEYIKLEAPGNSYLFSNNYLIQSTISATNRIMR